MNQDIGSRVMDLLRRNATTIALGIVIAVRAHLGNIYRVNKKRECEEAIASNRYAEHIETPEGVIEQEKIFRQFMEKSGVSVRIYTPNQKSQIEARDPHTRQVAIYCRYIASETGIQQWFDYFRKTAVIPITIQ